MNDFRKLALDITGGGSGGGNGGGTAGSGNNTGSGALSPSSSRRNNPNVLAKDYKKLGFQVSVLFN